MPSELLRSTKAVRRFSGNNPLIVTVGNFDGMHCGHTALFRAVRETAKIIPNALTVLLTLFPHPKRYFKRKAGQPLTLEDGILTGLRVKLERASQEDFSILAVLHFGQALANLEPEEFINQHLLALGNVKVVVVGEDWRFGRDRTGNVEVLKNFTDKRDLAVKVVPEELVDGVRVSSSLIRKLLISGDVNRAAKFLGRPYRLIGRVRHGDKMGRQLGFPTANLVFHKELLPAFGVYKTRVTVEGKSFRSVTNIGIKPTFTDENPIVETYILEGFSEEIYGKRLELDLLDYIRPEIRFSSLEELKAQIGKDVEIALRN